MKYSKELWRWALVLTCASAFAVDKSQDDSKAMPSSKNNTSAQVDNTDINKRDKGNETKTPQDQPNQTQDVQLLASVRRAIVGDKSLSSMAHNVKLHVVDGAVTLRGPVQNSKEKAKVESLASHVKGVTKTDNQLDVKDSKSAQ